MFDKVTMCILMTPVFMLLILYCRFGDYRLLLKNALSDKFFVIHIKNVAAKKENEVVHVCGTGATVRRKAFFDDCG